MANRIAIIVTSVLNTHPSPLSYAQRSVYTPHQRFEQTLLTINSIREKMGDAAAIYFVEGSAIDNQMEMVIKSVVDFYYNVSTIGEIKAAVDCPNKGFGEASKIKYVLDFIDQNKYDYIFKISGRYFLGPNFQLEKFISDRPTLCTVKRPDSPVCSTVLFSVPAAQIDHFKNTFQNIIESYKGNLSIFYEEIVTKSLEPVHRIDTCGVKGPVSVDNTFYVCE